MQPSCSSSASFVTKSIGCWGNPVAGIVVRTLNLKRKPDARTLTGVEGRYTEFGRPESLDPIKIPPPS